MMLLPLSVLLLTTVSIVPESDLATAAKAFTNPGPEYTSGRFGSGMTC